MLITPDGSGGDNAVTPGGNATRDQLSKLIGLDPEPPTIVAKAPRQEPVSGEEPEDQDDQEIEDSPATTPDDGQEPEEEEEEETDPETEEDDSEEIDIDSLPASVKAILETKDAVIDQQLKGVDKLKKQRDVLLAEKEGLETEVQESRKDVATVKTFNDELKDPATAPHAVGKMVYYIAETHGVTPEQVVADALSFVAGKTANPHGIKPPDFTAIATKAAEKMRFYGDDGSEKESWIESQVAIQEANWEHLVAQMPKAPAREQEERPKDGPSKVQAQFNSELQEYRDDLKTSHPGFVMSDEMATKAVEKHPTYPVELACLSMFRKELSEHLIKLSRTQKPVPKMIVGSQKTGKPKHKPGKPGPLKRSDIEAAFR